MMFGYDLSWDTWAWGHWGVGHWVTFTVMAAAILYPFGRILARLGFTPFWAVLALVPIVNVIALWALAFAPWPTASSGEPRGVGRL